jgi:glycosyltransferase involved in cell wall biosynthesis
MKIAYVALTRGNLSGGSRKHLDLLVPKLRAHPGVEWVKVFAHPNVARADECTWPAYDEWIRFENLRQSLFELRPDVVFVATARMLRVDGIPTVTMVRNMEPLEVPFGGNTPAEGVRNLLRAWTALRSCQESDRIIAVSGHVRDFLRKRWQIPPGRIGTVYHGIDIAVDDAMPPEPSFVPLLEGSRFLFTAGSVRPARGLEDLVQALPAVPDDLRVVIAGKVDAVARPYYRRLERLAEECGVRTRIHCVGQLGKPDMAWCFRNAARFVTTSRAEACPNTVLEAMAHGAVSISTDHAPMPEFFEDAALYYRERDAADLARRINESLALSDDEVACFRERGLARAREFTWEATARNTVEELRHAIEHR